RPRFLAWALSRDERTNGWRAPTVANFAGLDRGDFAGLGSLSARGPASLSADQRDRAWPLPVPVAHTGAFRNAASCGAATPREHPASDATKPARATRFSCRTRPHWRRRCRIAGKAHWLSRSSGYRHGRFDPRAAARWQALDDTGAPVAAVGRDRDAP